MKEKLLTFWNKQPLTALMLLAAIIRLPAVLFSKGFGWHDDHFLIIESSQSWADGLDYNNWFPWSGATNADGHSLFYSGLHYILFSLLRWIHLTDPQLKMFFVRLIHASFSLLIVYFGFKIVRLLKGEHAAKIAGLLLACYWFMPFLSVRNLVEFACIPFLVWGTWLALPKEKNSIMQYFLAGFILTLAVSVRYQTTMVVGGVVLTLLIQKQLKVATWLIVGSIISFILIQAPFDYIIWEKPFAEFGEYIKYNLENSDKYGANTWYSYLLVILGMLIPPVSFFLFFGFLKSWKKYTIIFLPSFIFLVFHSIFPNKQERFILTIVPFVIIGGVMGLMDAFEQNNWNSSMKKFLRGSVIFAVSLNLILLPLVSTMYSKRARVESMYYLSRFKDVKLIVIEDRKRDAIKLPPEFYAGQWLYVAEVRSDRPVDSLQVQVNELADTEKPKFVLFFQDYQIEKRVADMKNVFGNLSYEATIQPGFIDKILNALNPKNGNDVVYIYKTNIGAYKTIE